VQDMMIDIFMSVSETVPKETAKKDGRDWELWSDVMGELGVQAWRSNIAAHKGHDASGYWQEVIYQAIVYFRVLKRTKPQSRKLDHHGNVIAAKPESVTVIKSVRRIHKYFGVEMAHSKIYGSVLKAATVKFIENHGLSALMPKRKAPFTNLELRRMLSVRTGTMIGPLKVDAQSRLWKSVELLVHTLVHTGFRLADALRMNRDAMHYDFRNTPFPFADRRMVGHLTRTDFALVSPQRTKSDSMGAYWCPHPVYLDCGTEGFVRAGKLHYEYDVDFPVPLSERPGAPLFTDANGKRLTRQWLEGVLKAWMVLCSVDEKTHSWHSFRIYLACALKAVNADDNRIKAMVRFACFMFRVKGPLSKEFVCMSACLQRSVSSS
jgi:hypothetical protein